MSKDSKTVISFDLCRDLGFDCLTPTFHLRSRSSTPNLLTSAPVGSALKQLDQSGKGTSGSMFAALAKSGDPWWSSNFNTHGTFENVQSLHQGRWEKHVVSRSSCMKISTLLTAGSCTVKPCERNLQSANDHRFVWRTFSIFRKNKWTLQTSLNLEFLWISYTVGFIFEEWISSAQFNAREFRQKMRWAMGRNCPARRLMWDWQRMGRNMSKSYLIWTITLVTRRYRKSIAVAGYKLILWYLFIFIYIFCIIIIYYIKLYY